MWYSNESVSGRACTTPTSVPSSFTYSLKAISRGSLASMKSTNPGTRCLSASSFPVLSLFVAMNMNGPGIKLPPWVFRRQSRDTLAGAQRRDRDADLAFEFTRLLVEARFHRVALEGWGGGG